ncbi:MAG: phosphate acetyltransferase [Saccharofermentanales bacterium]
MGFLEDMIERAKIHKKTIVLPESNDIRIIEAVSIILKQNIADVILVGKNDDIKKIAGRYDISGVRIEDPSSSSFFEDYIDTYYELRKAKGVTLEQARQIMSDNIQFGVMMVKKGHADGMVAGAVYGTANTIRPAFQIIKTVPGINKVSSFFVMVVPDLNYGYNGIFVYADCSIIENPTSDQLSDIAISSAESFRSLIGAEPKIAMLSYSTYGSAKSDVIEKVINATKIARQKSPGIIIDGELQADAAIVPSVSEMKAPGSPLAGRANVLIFPDINSGNISYKLTERLAKAQAYGPIMQGIAKPVNVLSRGCSVKDIVGVVAITCVQANGEKNAFV